MADSFPASLLDQPVGAIEGAGLFGLASTKKTLGEVIRLLAQSVGDDARSAAAAYGMLLAANLPQENEYRDDALRALDQLSQAKMLLDQAACHLSPVILVTGEILLAAQVFADEATIACTEWPLPGEIASVVFEKAKNYRKRGDWRLHEYNERGDVVGVRVVTHAAIQSK